MKPTIGRIVHLNGDNRIVCAIITGVISDTQIRVRTFDEESEFPEFYTVLMGSGYGTWNWPPQITGTVGTSAPIVNKPVAPVNTNTIINPGVKQATAVTPVIVTPVPSVTQTK